LFFLPVVAGYLVMEYLSLGLPSAIKANQEYIKRVNYNFETLILGSSQIQSAVNPEWLDSSTLNLASGDQHHDTDFKLLKGFEPKLSNLKTVVIEVSYSHFELPHNGKDFWKNALYLKYFDVNSFERNTYFKDRLVYLSNPRFFSKKIYHQYIKKNAVEKYNDYGFNTENYEGQFKALGHDEEKIASMPRFKINTEPNIEIFVTNTRLFYEMLDYLSEKELVVIMAKSPMYKTYHAKRNPAILRRRDSVVADVLQKYHNVKLLDLETDTVLFKVNDYWNQSHLNPDGAKKFTAWLNALLKNPS
jgi:hypothetical protein